MGSATAKLDKVQKTLLATLHGKSLDNRAAHPLLGDRWAERVERDMGGAGLMAALNGLDSYVPVLRAERMDRWAQRFLDENPGATVVQLACGLDSRAFRLDVPDGVRWFDVDFPEVIDLRRRVLPATGSATGTGRYQLIASSVTDEGWLDQIPDDRPTLVLAEGLVMYLAEQQAWRLLDRLTDHFPHGELVLDVLAPWAARVAKPFGYFMWGLGDPGAIERRNPRLTLLESASAVDGQERIPYPLLRAYTRAMSRFSFYRNMINPLHFRIEPRG